MRPFVAGCRKHPSQGGDTGSNPVGTASAKFQVRALVPERSGSLNRDSNAGYPENIPSQIVPSTSRQGHPA
jgi:hypothetical protein